MKGPKPPKTCCCCAPPAPNTRFLGFNQAPTQRPQQQQVFGGFGPFIPAVNANSNQGLANTGAGLGLGAVGAIAAGNCLFGQNCDLSFRPSLGAAVDANGQIVPQLGVTTQVGDGRGGIGTTFTGGVQLDGNSQRASEASLPVASTMATLTGLVLAPRQASVSARTLRAAWMPPLSLEATSRRPSLPVFSSTDQTQPLESNPPFSDRAAPTSTSSTSLAVDQVFLFMKPSYLYQNTQVGIYDNKQKHRKK